MSSTNQDNLQQPEQNNSYSHRTQQHALSQHSLPVQSLNNKLPLSKKLTQLMQVHYEEISDAMNNTITNMLRKQRANVQIQAMKNKDIDRHYCQKCDCTGTSECNKKIMYLEGKLRHFLNTPYKKQIVDIYDVEKMGLDNQNYLVEYSDNTLERVSVKYLKKNYLKSYIQFLERKCFNG